jgi:hypothetical protein
VSIDTGILLGTAAGLAFVHTAIGVDHSIPFVVLRRARGWSLGRTLSITAVCGVGHVGSSVAIGALGVALGIGVERLTWLESYRGALAGWLLIGFGLAYAGYALKRSARGKRHVHVHSHSDGTTHSHAHDHHGEHLHPHGDPGGRPATPWILFVLFALGPCETLVPLMMAPAMTASWGVLIGLILVFGAVTVGTMLAIVAVCSAGLELGRHSSRRILRHADAWAGLAIAASGAAVMVFGI